jgi:hypothetical protein
MAVVMHKREAIKILEARLAAIEQEHRDELASQDTRSETDARAEAKTLAALYEFLNDCKISHRQSLLRILERYLRRKSSTGRGDAPIIQGVEGSRGRGSASFRRARQVSAGGHV